MNKFDPKSFTDIDASIRDELWAWMNEHDNVIRMETASDLNRVAVEPLQRFLLGSFDEGLIRTKRVKMMLGAMARQVLEARGYEWVGHNFKIPTGDLFSVGSKYRR